MRLAILIHAFGRFGGGERVAFGHQSELRRRGVDVDLYYTGPVPEEWAKRIDKQSYSPLPYGVPKSVRGFFTLLRFLLGLRGYNRILVHHHIEPIVGFLITRFFGKKTVWFSASPPLEVVWSQSIISIDYRSLNPSIRNTVRQMYGELFLPLVDYDLLFALARSVLRFLDIATVRAYRKIVANSAFTATVVKKCYRLKSAPRVCYPFVDPFFVGYSNGHKTTIASERRFILGIGALTVQKNFRAAIQALSLCKENVRLIIVGEGDQRDSLRKEAILHGVDLTLAGQRGDTELADYYLNCDFLVHPSYYEAIGLTPLEAAAFSKPSVITKHGGTTEFVKDGVTGFVVPIDDVKILADRIDLLLRNQSLRFEMGAQAHENLNSTFTIEASVKQLMNELASTPAED